MVTEFLDESRCRLTCPVCHSRFEERRLLNRAELFTGYWSALIAACGGCLTVTKFVGRPTLSPGVIRGQTLRSIGTIGSDEDVERVETVSTGGATAQFFERLARAAETGDLKSLHSAAINDGAMRWLLRMPESQPVFQALFVDGGTLTTDSFGVVHGRGPTFLERLDALFMRESFVPTARSANMIESSVLGSAYQVWRAGVHVYAPPPGASTVWPRPLRDLGLHLGIAHSATTIDYLAIPADLLSPL